MKHDFRFEKESKNVDNMKNAMSVLAILAAFIVAAMAFMPAGYAYSSTVTAEGEISATYSMINIYDKNQSDEEGSEPTYVVHDGPITDLALECKKNVEHGTTYYKYEGYVSNTLYVKMVGQEPARIQAMLTGASPDLYVQVLFNNSDAVVLDAQNNWTANTKEYQLDQYIPFTVFASAKKTTEDKPTLGNLSFAMVKVDEETGSSVLVGGNTIQLRMVKSIVQDSDVQNVLSDSNEHTGTQPAVAGNISTSSDPVDFYFVEGKDEGINSVYITTDEKDPEHVVDKNTSFNFDLTIPAGYEFCIMIHVSKALSATNVITLKPVDSIVTGSATVATDWTWGNNTTEYISVVTQVEDDITTYELKKSESGLVYGSCPNDLVLHISGWSYALWIQGAVTIQVIMR